MGYPLYQIVQGTSAVAFSNAVATASSQGWLVVGAASPSGSGFTILMTKGPGSGLLTTAELTHSVKPFASGGVEPFLTGSGLWQNVYPPQTATDTLLGINTNPNTISYRGTGSAGW